MAIKNNLTESFLQSVKEIQFILLEIGFIEYSFIEKGYAYYVQFKRDNTIVKFIFGPSDYQIEMIIYTSKGKFAFRDLLKITAISEWVNNYRYIQGNERNIREEMMWFIELLKFSLPIVE